MDTDDREGVSAIGDIPGEGGMPPLNALRTFNVAARAGSFTLAAQELNVSQGAVSRQIAHLEQFLGIKLFERRHREVKLTREGADYAAAMSTAFDEIIRGTRRLWRSRQNPSLRLKIFPTFAIRWLVPRLGDFHERYPEIDVQITTSMQAAQLDREEIDCTVVSHAKPQGRLVFDPLFEVELLPVCAKSLLSDHPSVTKPADLARFPLLHVVTRLDDWDRWFKEMKVVAQIVSGGLQFGDSALVYQAASNGAGIAMAQYRFVEDDLESGRLVSPVSHRVATGEAYYLATRRDEISSPTISVFREWIVAEASKDLRTQRKQGFRS